MPKPKYGYRECRQCGTSVALKIQRDITRKNFCSRSCSSKWHADHGALERMTANITEESHRKQSASLKRRYATDLEHPWTGRKHSLESKAKVAYGQMLRYVERPESYATGEQHGMWNGGISRERGYVKRKTVMHPKADMCGRVRDHVLIAEETLGRFLESGEVVHHINRQRDDNRLENLAVMTQDEHCALHSLKLLKPEFDGQFPSWLPLNDEVNHAKIKCCA